MSSTGKKRRGNRLLADELPLLFFPTGRMPCSEETQSVFERVLRDRGNAKRFQGGTADSGECERNQKMADNKIPVICVKDLYKIYRVGESKVRALNGVDFTIYKGEFCAIVGTSGSGKSTLLNMLAGLEKPTKGEIVIAGEHIENKTENQLVRFRREHIGFIFQSFNLLSTMTALENVALPLTFQGVDKAKRLKKASALLDLVKLGKYKNHRPTQMSGGQQQRVGVARALVVDPEIIFADEPTGNLDSNTSREVMELMQQVADKFPQITSLMYVDNQKGNDTINDLELSLFKGNDHIYELMEDLKFKVGPKSFYQTNTEQAYHLYCVAREFANLTGDELVYDLYTGTGTIANFVAHKAKKVIGIEYVPEAIEDAKVNSRVNNIENTLFYAGDMKDILTNDFIAQHGRPDVIITDPPRAGMHPDVINVILNAAPKRIVYVSCNPATQARDLQLMDAEYKVAAVQPVDMFPHTPHVENVVLLEKR